MTERLWTRKVLDLLGQFPAVAIIGSRQSGKTTVARGIVESRPGAALYLDLERPAHLARMADPELFLSRRAADLVVLDEIQCKPDLFPLLRGLIDEDRRPGRFLILGSAAPSLLRQSSESLAGRIAYVELPPFVLPELARNGSVSRSTLDRRWLRGGYPESFLAVSDAASYTWREQFIRTFLERDLPQLGVRTPATRLRRFWQMLAHWHGQLWNASELARSFEVSAPAVGHYLDLLTDTFVVRQLRPLHANLHKRLVKAPKVYLRDSGLLHTLLQIADLDALLGHPGLGASFEGFVVGQVLDLLPDGAGATFYRTHAGAEIDLVLDLPGRRVAVEVKYSSVPAASRGLREAMSDLGCREAWIVTPASETFPLAENIQATSLAAFLDEVILPEWKGGARQRGRAKS